MPDFDVLTPDGQQIQDVFEQVDHRLQKSGTGSPDGTVIGRTVGQRYVADNGAVYVVVATDGTASGTVWSDMEMDLIMRAAVYGSF